MNNLNPTAIIKNNIGSPLKYYTENNRIINSPSTSSLSRRAVDDEKKIPLIENKEEEDFEECSCLDENKKAMIKRLQIIILAQFGMFIGSTITMKRIILLGKHSPIWFKISTRIIAFTICLMTHFCWLTFYIKSPENSFFITLCFIAFSIYLHFNFLMLFLLISEYIVLCIISLTRQRVVTKFIPEYYRNIITIFGIFFSIILTIHGYTVTNSDYTLKRIDVKIPNLPPEYEHFSIVLLTDIHIGPTVYKDRVKKMVNTVNKLNPHMIAISGDLVDGYVEYLGERVKLINNLKSKYGTFFVTGNHEYYQDNIDKWMKFFDNNVNMTILRNSRQIIRRNNSKNVICVAGVDDIFSTNIKVPGHGTDAKKALEGCPDTNSTNILLVHQPNAANAILRSSLIRTKPVHLTLSGHTHAGQFYVVYPIAWLLNTYISGLHTVIGNSQIYVSAGTNFWGPPIKRWDSCEITLISLRKE
ncbi:Transmembrane protein with metallophosphoesterase domain [Strongyloides ratti]|uniref:Transmembrane protein with metallophosphoesterase domain n=1 Tax=Strongyloides ratti TaxID=34506 RepID=A0A090L7J0_STRRB|nr:Transmembrane protein with metallophosphoesterase domain [Strongyloides ratti]CEF65736.1 Transmembrane protein with metallophosphoesterase domain [Strongyloides ratti]